MANQDDLVSIITPAYKAAKVIGDEQDVGEKSVDLKQADTKVVKKPKKKAKAVKLTFGDDEEG